MSAPQAAAITACTACAAVGGAAAGGAFSGGSSDSSSLEDASPDNEVTSASTASAEEQNQEPNWFPLSQEINNGDYAGKLGKTYSRYLVGSFGTTSNSNTEWWKWSFKKYTNDKTATSPRDFSTEFAGLENAFSNDKTSVNTTTKALNKACDTAYKKALDDIKPNPSGETNQNKAKLRDDLWRYCSTIGERPKTVEENNDTDQNYKTPDNAIGKEKKAELLSTKAEINTKIWEWKNEEFKAKNSITNSTYFNDLLTKVKDTSTPKTLKDGCEEAYKVASTSSETATAPKDENVLKYCVLGEIAA